MIHMLYLMATHSSQMINYSAEKVHALICREKFIPCREKFTHFYAEKSLFHVEKSSRTFMQRKVYFM